MSDYIDTREGWREVDAQYVERQPEQETLILAGAPGRYWVREVPMPPLPTEPYTVIRATLTDGQEADLLLSASGHWGTAYGHAKIWATTEWINKQHLITAWVPLASPPTYTGNQYAEIQKARREAAKAMYDRVREFGWTPETSGEWERAAREFKVES